MVKLISNRVLLQRGLVELNAGRSLTQNETDQCNVDLATALSGLPNTIVGEYYALSGRSVFISNSSISGKLGPFDNTPCTDGLGMCSTLVTKITLSAPQRTALGLAWEVRMPVLEISTNANIGTLRVLFGDDRLKSILWEERSGLGTTGQLILARPNKTSYEFLFPPANNQSLFPYTAQLETFRTFNWALQSRDLSGVTRGPSYDGTNVVAVYRPVEGGSDWYLGAEVRLII